MTPNDLISADFTPFGILLILNTKHLSGCEQMQCEIVLAQLLKKYQERGTFDLAIPITRDTKPFEHLVDLHLLTKEGDRLYRLTRVGIGLLFMFYGKI